MASELSELLGGEKVLGPSLRSNLDLAFATREGLPSRTAIELACEILEYESEFRDPGYPFATILLAAARAMRDHAEREGLADLAAAAVPLTANVWDPIWDAIVSLGPLGAVCVSLMSATLSATVLSQMRARLTPAESDVVVRTARIMARATEVLGDKKKAVHWLTRPNKALGEVPISLLDTSAGEHEVEALLDRIEYGVYS